MAAERFYIYRCGRTDSCAVTATKNEARLLRSLCPTSWQFWMQITRSRTAAAVSPSMPPLLGFTVMPKATSSLRARPSCWVKSFPPRVAKGHPMADDAPVAYIFQCASDDLFTVNRDMLGANLP